MEPLGKDVFSFVLRGLVLYIPAACSLCSYLHSTVNLAGNPPTEALSRAASQEGLRLRVMTEIFYRETVATVIAGRSTSFAEARA